MPDTGSATSGTSTPAAAPSGILTTSPTARQEEEPGNSEHGKKHGGDDH
jgi:hypothetical protein